MHWTDGYLASKQTADGRWHAVMPLIFGRARIITDCDETGYAGAFY